MNWPSGDPNQPQHPPNQYPAPQYPPAYAPPPPPPMPYQPSYGQPAGPGTGTPYPPPPKKSRKGLIIALIVVAAVLVGGIVAVGLVVFFATKDTVVATDLAPGDCITDVPDADLVSLVPTVACSEPHSGEVYAVLTMPDSAYPGEASINEWQNRCPDQLESYSPTAMADDTVSVFVLYPTAETWEKGDRTVTCIATTDDKRTGSVRG